jgi:hypothetical protein
MEEQNPSSHETVRLSTPRRGRQRLLHQRKWAGLAAKTAGEFNVIFSLYPVEITGLAL